MSEPTKRAKILELLAKGMSRADVAIATNCHQAYVRAVIRRGETGTSDADRRYAKKPGGRAMTNARYYASVRKPRIAERKLIGRGENHGTA